MQIQPVNSFRVVYDIQKDKYYRVNKITGQIQPSYKTGKTPAKFNPNITGANYLARTKMLKFHTIDSTGINATENLRNDQCKNQTEISKKSLIEASRMLSNTQMMQSRISQQKQLGRKSFTIKKRELNSVYSNRPKQTSQGHRESQIKTQNQNTMTLPKLKKQNSQTKLDVRSISDLQLASPSRFKTIRNSQSNADSTFISSKSKQIKNFHNTNSNSNSFLNSMTKLNVLSGDTSISQSRVDFDKFQNKLRRYCQIEENKLQQNNFQPLQNNQKSKKLQKFAQKSLLTSILDQSHVTLNQTSNQLNMSSFTFQKQDLHTITKTQVLKNLDQLSKQKASLLLLAKKCQQQRSALYQRSKQSLLKKSSQPALKALDLGGIEQHKKLKSQLQQQKQVFLSFYPKYVFRQNPRLIQQQKDRKINLKKLQLLYLDGNDKKFGKIYHSQSKQKQQ